MTDIMGGEEPEEPEGPSEEDKNAAAVVDALIDSIGEVTLDSGEAIQAARDAYDKLTDTRKGLVTKLDTLITAETRYQELQDQKKADEAAAE